MTTTTDATAYVPFPKAGVPFVERTSRYGRAEFDVCSRYERGLLRRVFVTAHQQEHQGNWVLEMVGTVRNFDIETYGTGLTHPRIWFGGWCKEHGAVWMRMYVPDGSSRLLVHQSGDTCRIEFWNGEVTR